MQVMNSVNSLFESWSSFLGRSFLRLLKFIFFIHMICSLSWIFHFSAEIYRNSWSIVLFVWFLIVRSTNILSDVVVDHWDSVEINHQYLQFDTILSVTSSDIFIDHQDKHMWISLYSTSHKLFYEIVESSINVRIY